MRTCPVGLEPRPRAGVERRSMPRCPVCHGPALEDREAPGGVRCRNSICVHNHQEVVCPRCGRQDLEAVGFESGAYRYTCADCQCRW